MGGPTAARMRADETHRYQAHNIPLLLYKRNNLACNPKPILLPLLPHELPLLPLLPLLPYEICIVTIKIHGFDVSMLRDKKKFQNKYTKTFLFKNINNNNPGIH